MPTVGSWSVLKVLVIVCAFLLAAAALLGRAPFAPVAALALAVLLVILAVIVP